jgi:chemotaxis protein MotB
MSKDNKSVIVIKKVKKGHAGHHGGAWKVAYADFVTAMMAFFLVMWIINMDESVKEAIEGYFQNPSGFGQGQGSPLSVISFNEAGRPGGAILPMQVVARQIEEQRYREIGERIQMQLQGPDGLGEIAAQVEIVITDQGLRIELVEGGDGEHFFAPASSDLKAAASRAIQVIGRELRAVSSPVVVEGHTDARPFTSRSGYSNWELSADRANAARRVMEPEVGATRIAEIRGHADRHPRVAENPYDNANRRISILVPFTTPPPPLSEKAELESGS